MAEFVQLPSAQTSPTQMQGAGPPGPPVEDPVDPVLVPLEVPTPVVPVPLVVVPLLPEPLLLVVDPLLVPVVPELVPTLPVVPCVFELPVLTRPGGVPRPQPREIADPRRIIAGAARRRVCTPARITPNVAQLLLPLRAGAQAMLTRRREGYLVSEPR
jgi:hypothetical protein